MRAESRGNSLSQNFGTSPDRRLWVGTSRTLRLEAVQRRFQNGRRMGGAVSNDWATASFEDAKRRYFDPLREDLGLTETHFEVSPRWGEAIAADDILQLRLEHDRGLRFFSVQSAMDSSRTFPVDELAKLFPRVRAMPFGDQRLTLEEQTRFLRERWPELRQMLSLGEIDPTRRLGSAGPPNRSDT
jgi:hypothetical protein